MYPRKKSRGVRSVLRTGQGIGHLVPIHDFGNFSFKVSEIMDGNILLRAQIVRNEEECRPALKRFLVRLQNPSILFQRPCIWFLSRILPFCGWSEWYRNDGKMWPSEQLPTHTYFMIGQAVLWVSLPSPDKDFTLRHILLSVWPIVKYLCSLNCQLSEGHLWSRSTSLRWTRDGESARSKPNKVRLKLLCPAGWGVRFRSCFSYMNFGGPHRCSRSHRKVL